MHAAVRLAASQLLMGWLRPTVSLLPPTQGDSVHKPGAVRVLRCQLPRENSFYASEPAEPGDLAPPSLPVRPRNPPAHPLIDRQKGRGGCRGAMSEGA